MLLGETSHGLLSIAQVKLFSPCGYFSSLPELTLKPVSALVLLVRMHFTGMFIPAHVAKPAEVSS